MPCKNILFNQTNIVNKPFPLYSLSYVLEISIVNQSLGYLYACASNLVPLWLHWLNELRGRSFIRPQVHNKHLNTNL
jgi:hypothetical protein